MRAAGNGSGCGAAAGCARSEIARFAGAGRLSASSDQVPSSEADAIHRRQVMAHGLEAVAPGDPQRAGGRSHRQRLAGGVDVQAVAVDEIVGVLLRQALTELLETAPAV